MDSDGSRLIAARIEVRSLIEMLAAASKNRQGNS